MFYNIINSEHRAGDTTTVINPRTNEPLWEVTVANETDLNDAVHAARVASKSWKLLSVDERQKCLLNLADELEKRRNEIHGPLAAETGKSVRMFIQYCESQKVLLNSFTEPSCQY